MTTTYPPIADYGFIGDCFSAALISKYGSIDWCCMPSIDSSSCFGRLLDWDKGGFCEISPIDDFDSSHNYLDRTMILETHFKTKTAHVRIFDFFSMRKTNHHQPHQQLIRIVEGLEGDMKIQLKIVPRFDYGAIAPDIKQHENTNVCTVIGGSSGLLLSGNIQFDVSKNSLGSEFVISQGQKVYLSIIYKRPEELTSPPIDVPSIEEFNLRFEETHNWWENWLSKGDFTNVCEPKRVERSVLVLKSLANFLTGAIIAAPTTSLPEAFHGERNWDYRYSWVRDSFFTVLSLSELGFDKEAIDFHRFIQRCTADNAEELQVVYGRDGRRRLLEFTLDLNGYLNSKPVRVGNLAYTQKQLDVYGYLLSNAWRLYKLGHSPDRGGWDFLVSIVNKARQEWQNPGSGIWEFRDDLRHFVFSKVMCWTAINLGIKLGHALNYEAPYKDWKKTGDEIRESIESKGYDKSRGVFIQAFDKPIMDASLLLLPVFGFIDHTDERMIRTTDAIIEDLEENGLIRRYPLNSDPLKGEEGIFVTCTFWLVNNLVRQNRSEKAQKFFDTAIATANNLGLFSEEFDTKNKKMLGNFPQALAHLSLITAALVLKNPAQPLIDFTI